MHSADAFIQSDLHHFRLYIYCQYVCSLGIEPTTFALLTQCSTTEPQEHWCHMDYFNDVLTTFLNLDHVILYGSLLSMEGQRALRIHQKYLNFCSDDWPRSHRFGTTWKWVINIFVFRWIIPLSWNKCRLWLSSCYLFRFYIKLIKICINYLYFGEKTIAHLFRFTDLKLRSVVLKAVLGTPNHHTFYVSLIVHTQFKSCRLYYGAD